MVSFQHSFSSFNKNMYVYVRKCCNAVWTSTVSENLCPMALSTKTFKYEDVSPKLDPNIVNTLLYYSK